MAYFKLDKKKFPTCVGRQCDICGITAAINHNFMFGLNFDWICDTCLKDKNKVIGHNIGKDLVYDDINNLPKYIQDLKDKKYE